MFKAETKEFHYLYVKGELHQFHTLKSVCRSWGGLIHYEKKLCKAFCGPKDSHAIFDESSDVRGCHLKQRRLELKTVSLKKKI